MTPLNELPEGKMRLNRYLALCGLGSRRQVEREFISCGRVALNGVTIQNPGEKIGREDRVTVDGTDVVPRRFLYIVMNKPRGVVCAVRDRFNRTVFDLLPSHLGEEGLFPVGRLDKESEGILILTNDGQFMQDLIHPSRGVHKTYDVLLDRRPTPPETGDWEKGICHEGKKLVPVSVTRGKGAWIRIVLSEGVKREIRIMAMYHGFKVRRLIRRAVGRMVLSRLERGSWEEKDRDDLWKLINRGGMV
jgi:23S rRNA pseudouridine2605 synthase